MNEDNQNLENKCSETEKPKSAKKLSVKVGHIQKLMRIYKPLLKATDKLQTELYSGQSPSNDFTRAHFDEIKEFWPKGSRVKERIDEVRLNLRRRIRGSQHGIT